MESHYFCNKCNQYHEIESRVGMKHLPYNLSKNDLTTFINVATTIPTYEVVTKGIPHVFEGTHDFVRENSGTASAKVPEHGSLQDGWRHEGLAG